MKQSELYHGSIANTLLQFIKKKELIGAGQHVIVAVSGGIDSMVLLDMLATHRDQLKISLSVAHVNHMLRGKESKADEKFVIKEANEYGIPFYVDEVRTKQFSVQEKISIQESARILRYKFFDNLKKSLHADHVATAHTADDNTETMLFLFFRGAGIEGLSGIPMKRDQFVRPMLSLTRNEIVQYARSKKIKYRDDASNQKEIYTRNFIRRTLVPQIVRRINPALSQTLQKESEIFTLLSEFVNREIGQHYPSVVKGSSIFLGVFGTVDPYIQHMIVKKMLEQRQIEPTFPVIATILELKDHQKGNKIDISSEWIAERTADSILFYRRNDNSAFHFEIASESSVSSDHFSFSIKKVKEDKHKKNSDSSIEYIDADKISFPLVVRSWCEGDAFIPLGMKGKKKLSDFFGEKKLTSEQKSSTPIIVSDGAIVWVAGLRLDDRFKITKSTKHVIKLSLTYHG